MRHVPRYANGFTPRLNPQDLGRQFKKDGLVFVGSMGDMFGDWVGPCWIECVLEIIELHKNTTFLFCTKNPARYFDFLEIMPQNVILGATIETNRSTELISKAPPLVTRMASMSHIIGWDKMVSIEPIMKFDHEVMVDWIKAVRPLRVYVGYDNYPQRNHLDEPTLEETEALIAELGKFTTVYRKTIRKAHDE